MIFNKFILRSIKFSRCRFAQNICTSSRLEKGAYDVEGKTKVEILDNQRQPDVGLIIEGYSQMGFRLSSGVKCLGPIVLFSRSVLSWSVKGPHDITVDSLSLFLKLEPKLDILILGIGDNLDRRRHLQKSLQNEIVKKHGINLEILTTDHACSTYNFLCSEFRLVAGAFLPPLQIRSDTDDVIKTRHKYKTIYSLGADDPDQNKELLLTDSPSYKKILEIEERKIKEEKSKVNELSKKFDKDKN